MISNQKTIFQQTQLTEGTRAKHAGNPHGKGRNSTGSRAPAACHTSFLLLSYLLSSRFSRSVTKVLHDEHGTERQWHQETIISLSQNTGIWETTSSSRQPLRWCAQCSRLKQWGTRRERSVVCVSGRRSSEEQEQDVEHSRPQEPRLSPVCPDHCWDAGREGAGETQKARCPESLAS